MTIEQYIQNKKNIQASLLNYIDEENEENFKHLIKLFDDLNIKDNRNELKSILQLMSAIIQNHHRSPNFFSKIEKIITNYLPSIKKYFSNSEIFRIFCPNQRILLFLLRNNLISDDELIELPDDHMRYFYPEIKSKVDELRLEEIFEGYQDIIKNFNQEEFDAKREIGENDSYICKLIREDSIEEFIKYINQTNFQLEGQIKWSIFETNWFLWDHFKRMRWRDENPTLMEYSFFFGSIQIVKYLLSKNVKLTYELWPFAIHSNNPELIQLLEENKLIPPESYFITRSNAYIPKMGFEHMKKEVDEMDENEDEIDEDEIDDDEIDEDEIDEDEMDEDDDENNEINKTKKMNHKNKNREKTVWDFNTFKSSMVESIKCHHNSIYNYIIDNTPEMKPDNDSVNEYFKRQFKSDSRTDVTFAAFKYFNYDCFPDQIDDNMLFFYACKYDYPSIVEKFLNDKNIDVNMKIIQFKI